MLWSHVKKHWWKYYLGAGAVYAGYEFLTNNQTETIFGTALNVVGWPFYLVSGLETNLGRQL